MKKHITTLFATILLLAMNGCVENNIDFVEEIDVPEGIYLTGTASEFSVEAAKGQFTDLKDGVLFSINTWIKNSGDFRISFVAEDGQPVSYGQGESQIHANPMVKTHKLVNNAAQGFTVEEEGLYQIVINKSLNEINIIPCKFEMTSNIDLTENGQKKIFLDQVSYDRVSHIITFQSGDKKQIILPAEYRLANRSEAPITVNYSETEEYTLPFSYTGLSANVRANVLTQEYTELTNESPVNLKLKQKGNYMVSMQYHVHTGKYTAKMEGEEIVEPEPQGYPARLFMGGDNFGSWATDAVEMTPVGVSGNGSFWAIRYFTAGKSILWSNDSNGANAYTTLGTNLNYTVQNGQATVAESGYYLVYVDMHRKLISFETPEVYGFGDCFTGGEAKFDLNGDEFVATTAADGNLHLFATSAFNNRDWNSMEFGIRNGKVDYYGVNTTEREPVPVAGDVPIKLNFKEDTGKPDKPFASQIVPNAASAIYMIGSLAGTWNWGSEKVEAFDRSYSENYRWFYVNYFEAGTTMRFSADRYFGKSEFVQLQTNEGFTVANDMAVIPNDGIYMVYIDLALRMIYVQEVSIYGYIGSTRVDFTKDASGKTMSATLPATGRMRLYAGIPILSTLSNPRFSDWKRELYIDPATLAVAFRKPGAPEPNAGYQWQAGTTVTFDFPNKRGIITPP